MLNRLLIILGMALLFASCANRKKAIVDDGDLSYRKVLKATDPEIKYKYANIYFEEEEWGKALPLYEELIPIKRLTEKGQEVYYRYAMCYYKMRDYYLSAYYFRRFRKNYPSSPRSEDAAFMSAMSNVKLSPVYSLDQTETKKAINELQLFLDRYPDSPRKDTCNQIVDQLRGKLELKQVNIAKLYYHTEYYKSAVIAIESTLEQYPGTEYKEELLFLRVKSGYYLADKSVPSKKLERFENTIDYYHNFVDAFPNSEKLDDAEDYMNKSLKAVEEIKAQTQPE